MRRIIVTTLVCLAGVILVAWVWRPGTPRPGSPLQGRISVAGRPVTFGTVTVVAGDGTVQTTAIRPDGTYAVPHVPPGAVRFAVSSPDPRTVFDKARAAGDAPARPASAAGDPGRAGPRSGGGAAPEPGGDTTIAARAPLPRVATPAQSRPEHAGWFRIPGRYANPAESGLRGTVDAAGSTVDLDLEPVPAARPR